MTVEEIGGGVEGLHPVGRQELAWNIKERMILFVERIIRTA
jgi:hypothetical protein